MPLFSPKEAGLVGAAIVGLAGAVAAVLAEAVDVEEPNLADALVKESTINNLRPEIH